MKINTSYLHLDALPVGARKLLPKLKSFAPRAILGGGTAIALQSGHRKSFDLDLFVIQPISRNLLERAKRIFGKARPLVDSSDELSFIASDVKISVIRYPFKELHLALSTEFIDLFDLQDLASSKAYTIGRRGVWRDYVDLFDLLKNGLRLDKIIQEAEKRFGESFNAKLFLEQLSYFGDVHDFTISWLDKEYSQVAVKSFLKKQAKEFLKTL